MALDRKHFIGGSDAAAVLGLAPYEDATPLTTYMQKAGLLPPREFDEKQLRVLRRGKKLEPYVVDTLIEVYGVKVTKRSSPENPNRYVDQEHDFLAAEVDFEFEVTQDLIDEYCLDPDLLGTTQNGEVKTHHHFVASKKYGDEGTDEIPVEFFCQGMHGLGVTRRKLTMVAMMSGSEDPTIYWVKLDPATLLEMRARLVKFWHENILAGVPPPPINNPDIALLLSRSEETRIEATPEVEALVASLMTTRANAAMLRDAEEGLKFQIGQYVLKGEGIDGKQKPGRHVVTSGGTPILQIQLESQNRIDLEKLRERHPEIAEECTEQSSFFKYSKPRKGSK